MSPGTSVLLGLIAVASILAAPGHAATVRPLDFDALVARADAVVYGRVRASRSFWDSTTRSIWTESEVLVSDCAKGRTGPTVVIAEPGGVLGDVAHLVPGAPRLEQDAEVVLFLYDAPGGRLRVVGLRQGIYQVVRDPGTGERLARPALLQSEEVRAGGGPAATVSAARPARGELQLGELLERIRARGNAR